MAITIGGGASNYRIMSNMRKTNALMNKAMERISSGLKINSAIDDAGGLAMGMRLSNETSIAGTLQKNVDNAKSFVDAQASALESAHEIVSEMKEIKVKHDSATATNAEKAAYESEFQELRSQLNSLTSESFNGKALFGTTTYNVSTSSDGSTTVEIGGLDLSSALVSTTNTLNIGDPSNDTSNGGGGSDLVLSTSPGGGEAQVTSTELDEVLNNISGLMAQAGGDSSTLGFTSSYLDVKAANLEAARSRVMDADIAEESTNLSKYTIQYEASVAAMAQANATQQTVMELLLFPNK